MNHLLLLLSSITILFGLICILSEGVIYYVSSTESLSSCPGSSSCPSGQLCHTMDYLIEHSSEFFSSDHVNITLIFMCGVHNYTKNLMVQHLQSFVLKGTSDSREKTVIDQFVTRLNKPNCTLLQFFNISFVNIANLTMRCPSLNVIESHIIVESSTLYGHTDTKETFSFINITGRGSQGLLDNCTFKENFFIMSNLSDGITVSNSTFQLCRHQFNSIIMAYSSAVTLTGSVNFTDSATGIHLPARPSGTAVFLRNTYPELKSVLIITTGTTVYFVNLTCNHYGGAIYVENGII